MFFTQCYVSVVFQMHSKDDGHVQVKFNWKSDGFNTSSLESPILGIKTDLQL